MKYQIGFLGCLCYIMCSSMDYFCGSPQDYFSNIVFSIMLMVSSYITLRISHD
jgi:uncharacterized protein YjaG (DUF416 family)